MKVDRLAELKAASLAYLMAEMRAEQKAVLTAEKWDEPKAAKMVALMVGLKVGQ